MLLLLPLLLPLPLLLLVLERPSRVIRGQQAGRFRIVLSAPQRVWVLALDHLRAGALPALVAPVRW